MSTATVIDRSAMLLAADGAAEAARLLRVAANTTTAATPATSTALTVVLAGVVLEHCPVTAETALRAGQALAAAAARRLALLPVATDTQEATDAQP